MRLAASQEEAVLQNGVIVCRTGEGAKLDATSGAKVAFEVDVLDVGTRGGWSVVVRGVADEITDDDDWFVEASQSDGSHVDPGCS